MASVRIAMAVILMAACGPHFDRVLETRAVYDAVITTEAADWGGQTVSVFVETVSDGDPELTLPYLRRHRQQAARAYGVWLPALADYVSRRSAGRRLEGGFSAPHRMVDRADPATWSNQGPWLRFSPVGFDEQGRYAIVLVQRGRERLPPAPSPLPAIGRPFDPLQVDAVLAGVPAWASRDDDAIAGLERVDGDAVARQTVRIGPFGAESGGAAFRVGDVDIHPRVGRAVRKLGDGAFDRHRPVFEVIGRERVVAERNRRNSHRECQRHKSRSHERLL